MKISVVIPMYNSKDTIKDSIKSVIDQKYNGSIEIIVINDGSVDGSEIIVNEIIKKNETNRSIKLINKENGGVSSARNIGIKEAKGDWVAFLDSDDTWLPNKLDKQISVIKKNNNIKFIGCNRNSEIYPFFNKSKKYIYKFNIKEILFKWYPSTPTVIVCKEILYKSGLYNETISHAEDCDLWLRISELCDLYVLNENLVYTGNGKRTFGESGLSANMPEMHKGEILSLKGAKKRNQINVFEYIFFYIWLKIKYFRRLLIVKVLG